MYEHTKEEVDLINSPYCCHCDQVLVGKITIFCIRCFFALPALERQTLRRAFLRGHPFAAKVERCKRILSEKSTSQPTSK